MLVLKSLLEKGTVIEINSGPFGFHSNMGLVVSCVDTVTESGLPGVEVKYIPTTRIIDMTTNAAECIPTSKELLVIRDGSAMMFGLTRVNTRVFCTTNNGCIGGIVFHGKLSDAEMYRLDVTINNTIANTISEAIITATKTAVSTIPIQFVCAELRKPENTMIYRLFGEAIHRDKDIVEFVSKIDPLFVPNGDYFGTGSTEIEALLNFKNNLKNHIAFLNYILLKAESEWEKLESKETKLHENEKQEKPE